MSSWNFKSTKKRSDQKSAAKEGSHDTDNPDAKITATAEAKTKVIIVSNKVKPGLKSMCDTVESIVDKAVRAVSPPPISPHESASQSRSQSYEPSNRQDRSGSIFTESFNDERKNDLPPVRLSDSTLERQRFHLGSPFDWDSSFTENARNDDQITANLTATSRDQSRQDTTANHVLYAALPTLEQSPIEPSESQSSTNMVIRLRHEDSYQHTRAPPRSHMDLGGQFSSEQRYIDAMTPPAPINIPRRSGRRTPRQIADRVMNRDYSETKDLYGVSPRRVHEARNEAYMDTLRANTTSTAVEGELHACPIPDDLSPGSSSSATSRHAGDGGTSLNNRLNQPAQRAFEEPSLSHAIGNDTPARNASRRSLDETASGSSGESTRSRSTQSAECLLRDVSDYAGARLDRHHRRLTESTSQRHFSPEELQTTHFLRPHELEGGTETETADSKGLAESYGEPQRKRQRRY